MTSKEVVIMTSNKLRLCPECETLSERRFVSRDVTHVIRNETITVPAKVAICTHCDKEVGDREQDGAMLRSLYDKYRQRHNIISPNEIKDLRERYGLSQRAFGQLLNWGEVTIHRYEMGSLPDTSHNDWLKRLQHEGAMAEFINENEHRLSPLGLQRMHDAVTHNLRGIGTAGIRVGLDNVMNSHTLVERGFRTFDFERIGHMVVYFASKGAPSRVKLLKMLWFADFLACKRLGLSISGTSYRKWPLGPVPDDYETLLEQVQVDGLALSEPFVKVFKGELYEGIAYHAQAEFDESLFTPQELDVLNAVHSRFANLTATQIMNLSHKEKGWRETLPLQAIPYTFASDLSID